MSKTSWSTEHLRQLKEITNHKVIYDGYEFVWLSKIDGKWQRHYIDNFKDYNKPMGWIYFNINKWNKEYEQRSLSYMKNMQLDLEIEVRITEISREANIKTKEKIEEIVKLKPSINNQEIADILGVTVRTVRRIRDK